MNLTPLVNAVNALDGYSNRYRVVMHAERKDGEARRMMLVKAEGPLDRRESQWLLPGEMASFLQGFIAGHNAATRRIVRPARGRRQTYVIS